MCIYIGVNYVDDSSSSLVTVAMSEARAARPAKCDRHGMIMIK